MILIGDCCEEPLSEIERLTAALRRSVPVYAFHEGDDTAGRAALEAIASLTGGVMLPFNSNSPNQLRELLGAVAAYVVGGLEALADHRPEVVKLITHGGKS